MVQAERDECSAAATEVGEFPLTTYQHLWGPMLVKVQRVRDNSGCAGGVTDRTPGEADATLTRRPDPISRQD
jgi:hypothetical protein